MITIEDATGAVSAMKLCRYFPADEYQRAQVAVILVEMVNTKEELDWLTKAQCKLDWKGPYELRLLFSSRFSPRDGIPGADDGEAAYIERESAETDRRIAAWKAEQKLLGDSPAPLDVTPFVKHIDRTPDDLHFREVQEKLSAESHPPIHIPATPVRTPEEHAALVRELETKLGIEPIPRRFGYCSAFELIPGSDFRFRPNLPILLA